MLYSIYTHRNQMNISSLPGKLRERRKADKTRIFRSSFNILRLPSNQLIHRGHGNNNRNVAIVTHKFKHSTDVCLITAEQTPQRVDTFLCKHTT